MNDQSRVTRVPPPVQQPAGETLLSAPILPTILRLSLPNTVAMTATALAAIAESDLVAAVPAGIATRHAARFGVSLHPMPVDAGGFELASIRALKPAADPGLDWLEARIVAAVPAGT